MDWQEWLRQVDAWWTGLPFWVTEALVIAQSIIALIWGAQAIYWRSRCRRKEAMLVKALMSNIQRIPPQASSAVLSPPAIDDRNALAWKTHAQALADANKYICEIAMEHLAEALKREAEQTCDDDNTPEIMDKLAMLAEKLSSKSPTWVAPIPPDAVHVVLQERQEIAKLVLSEMSDADDVVMKILSRSLDGFQKIKV